MPETTARYFEVILIAGVLEKAEKSESLVRDLVSNPTMLLNSNHCQEGAYFEVRAPRRTLAASQLFARSKVALHKWILKIPAGR